jgi:hypothetical protein
MDAGSDGRVYHLEMQYNLLNQGNTYLKSENIPDDILALASSGLL